MKIVAIVLVSVSLFACKGGGEGKEQAGGQNAGDRKVLFYRSPMNPSFVSSKPGKDAMGMDLVPVYEGEPGADLNTIMVNGAMIQRMGVRIQKIERGKLTRIVRAIGQVVLDETRVADINMKFDGWIEKLWVAETGQFVRKGDPLFAVYSPELWASQEEYLQIVKRNLQGPHAAHLLKSARQRLLQFDVPQGFLEEITKSGEPRRRVTIRAPATGYVVEKSAFEGTYVKEGSNLFRIADLDALWVIADVFETDAPWVHVDQEATVELDYLPGNLQTAKVDYVYPTLNEKTRTIQVRLVLPNPAVLLKPGMFATVRIHTHPVEDAVLVPTEAVIHSGERNVAFVSLGEGRFDPRDLELGVLGDENYQVLSGLKAGENVVVSSQFLLDSESRLKEVALKMLGSNIKPESKPSAPAKKPPKPSAPQDHAQ